MGWSERYFKGKKVYALTDDGGEFVVEDGRVQMKYSSGEDATVYRANPSNLSSSGDDKNPTAKSSKKGGTKSSSSSRKGNTQQSLGFSDLVWEDPEGERNISHEVPDELLAIAPPEPGILEFHTDGACSGNPGPCGYGLVLRSDDDYLEISQYIGIGTNNIAELYAILVALELTAERGEKAVIHTDSQLSIGLLTLNWKAKKNRELVSACRELYDRLDVEFVKVKGHAGIPLNERADDLAVASLER